MNNNAKIIFRKAEEKDASRIWEILQQAILRRKIDGSKQWQDGYPNLEVVLNDIENGFGYVLTENSKITTYAAIIYNDEPAYQEIEGKWLSESDFYVIHRVAVHDEFIGRGYAKEIFRKIEEFSKNKNVFSIKVDTNFDNIAMLKIFENLGYHYCGKVYFRGSARKAYEKLIQ